MGIPKKVGINDVNELLPLIKLIATPQRIKNSPYKTDIFSMVYPKITKSLKLFSFIFLTLPQISQNEEPLNINFYLKKSLPPLRYAHFSQLELISGGIS